MKTTLLKAFGCAMVLLASSAFTLTHAADLTPAETKAIAEEGYIYGLPIVMNYAIMNEYAVDKNTNQFKAPFNHIKNEPRVYTYKDTAVLSPNSDTPYSLAWLDLRAEPVVITVPEVEKGRYYSVQLVDGNLYNDGYIGSRATGNEAGSLCRCRPRLARRSTRGRRQGLPFDDAVHARHFPHPAVQSRRHAQRGKDSGRIQGPNAVGIPRQARASGGAGH